jgi:hypothetical protein
MVQLLRILSALNFIYALACLTILRWFDFAAYGSLVASLLLFAANIWSMKKNENDAMAIVSNLIFNTISVAIILWIWI